VNADKHLQVQAPQYPDCKMVEFVERLLSEKMLFHHN